MPALLYLAAATTSRRLAMRGALILLATFALPVFAYSGIAKVQTGHFNLSDEGSIAGRIADSVELRDDRAARRRAAAVPDAGPAGERDRLARAQQGRAGA